MFNTQSSIFLLLLFVAIVVCSPVPNPPNNHPKLLLYEPRIITECVDAQVCGPAKRVSDLKVDYFCKCFSGFEGVYCERSTAIFKMKVKSAKLPLTTAVLLHGSNGKFCVDVQTQCQNGHPIIHSVQPVCE